jgi:hypothetical protein
LSHLAFSIAPIRSIANAKLTLIIEAPALHLPIAGDCAGVLTTSRNEPVPM